MRKTIFTILLTLLTALSVFADGEYKIVLNEDDNQKSLELGYVNINVTMGEPNAQGRVDIMVEVINPNEVSNNMLFLFGRSFDEKQLRALKDPRVVYDWNYPVKKPRYTDYCEQLGRDVVGLDPNSSNYRISHLQLTEDETLEIRLPFYLAIKKKCFKKAALMEKHVEKLIISVELTPDEDYPAIKKSCDSIAEVISHLTFCNNPKHKPSLEEREQPYKNEVSDLRLAINLKLQQWPAKSFKYRKYNELKQQLDDIEFKEADCGNPDEHTFNHYCKYCKLTLEEIYDAFDDLYQEKVYPKKELTKEEMLQVKAMYKCCTDKTCRSHAAEWKKQNKYKDGIIDYYDRITKYYNSQK